MPLIDESEVYRGLSAPEKHFIIDNAHYTLEWKGKDWASFNEFRDYIIRQEAKRKEYIHLAKYLVSGIVYLMAVLGPYILLSNYMQNDLMSGGGSAAVFLMSAFISLILLLIARPVLKAFRLAS